MGGAAQRLIFIGKRWRGVVTIIFHTVQKKGESEGR